MWKNANFFILLLQLILLTTSLFVNSLAFGHGLGDVVFYIVMILMLIVNLILTVFWKDNENKLKWTSIVFGILLLFICLKATIFRSTEYPWNGTIFYENL